MNGYDEIIEDVRSKIGWDYVYLLSMFFFVVWVKLELLIILWILFVVFIGKG